MVTVWAVLQFALVNVTVPVTIASPVSEEVISNTTSSVGVLFKTMVKVSVVPVSETVLLLLEDKLNPAESLSVVCIFKV